MLSSLNHALFGAFQTKYPSMFLAVGEPSRTEILHIVPEDGVVEILRSRYPGATKFRSGPAKERCREQINTVLIHIGDGESQLDFLDDIRARVMELLGKGGKPKTVGLCQIGDTIDVNGHDEDAVPTIERALRSAVAGSLQGRQGQKQSMNATQNYPVYLVHVDRSRVGRLTTDAEMTSFPR